MFSFSFILAIALVAKGSTLAQLDGNYPAFEPRVEPTQDGTRGTGTRGPVRDGGTCIAEGAEIALLVPANSPLTTEALPGFLAVLPLVTEEGVDRGELRIFDEEGSLYRSTFPLPDTGGTIALSPPEIPELEPDVTYNWSVRILCNEVDNSQNPISVGEFRIVEPTPEVRDALGSDSCTERPALCARDGIWYDSLEGLFEARLADPDNEELDAAWKSLLESAELGEYAEIPLVGRWAFDE
ncbi:DUF928 domain-containing protein [Baaleninema sp.]|uniref:DUF928 domain-containing protein n=1 Tax=Baaleninema sp. TaxID=3101197 RepID=UPI003D02AF1B